MPLAWKTKTHWVSDGGDFKIPVSGHPDRKVFDQKFTQALTDNFIRRAGQRLVARQIPMDQLDTTNQAVNPERLELYLKMARAGEKLPPAVVKKVGGRYQILDGNHRHAAARAAGKKHLSVYEIQGAARLAASEKLGKSQRDRDVTQVASVAPYRDGKLLWGRRQDDGKWTLPGGHLNPGEDPARGAVRELLEETGLKPQTLERLGQGQVPGRDICVHSYRAEVEGEPNADQDPDAELVEFRWLLPGELPGPLHNPENVTLQLLGLQKPTMPLSKTEAGDQSIEDRILNDPKVDKEQLEQMATSFSSSQPVLSAVLKHPLTDSEILRKMAGKYLPTYIQRQLLEHPLLDRNGLGRLSQHRSLDPSLIEKILEHPLADAGTVAAVADAPYHLDWDRQRQLLDDPRIGTTGLEKLAQRQDLDPSLIIPLLDHPNSGKGVTEPISYDHLIDKVTKKANPEYLDRILANPTTGARLLASISCHDGLDPVSKRKILAHPKVDTETLHQLLHHEPDPKLVDEILAHPASTQSTLISATAPDADAARLHRIYEDPRADAAVISQLAQHRNLDQDLAEKLIQDPRLVSDYAVTQLARNSHRFPELQQKLLQHPQLSREGLQVLAGGAQTPEFAESVLAHPDTGSAILSMLLRSPAVGKDPGLVEKALTHPRADSTTLKAAIGSPHIPQTPELRQRLLQHPGVDYDTLSRLVESTPGTETSTLKQVLQHPQLTREALAGIVGKSLPQDQDEIQNLILGHPKTDNGILRSLTYNNYNLKTLQAAIQHPEADGTVWEHAVSSGLSRDFVDAERVRRQKVRALKPLVIVHSTSPEKLKKAHETLGGLVAPSIAVSRAGDKVGRFGSVGLLFRPETVDPRAGHHIYGHDVWSPRIKEVLDQIPIRVGKNKWGGDYAYTEKVPPEKLVQAMFKGIRAGEGGSGLTDSVPEIGPLKALVTRKFSSLAAVKKDSKRLVNSDDQWSNGKNFTGRIKELVHAGVPVVRILKASKGGKVDKHFDKHMLVGSRFPEGGDDANRALLKQKLQSLSDDLRDSPTDYFEAKPKAVIPVAGTHIPVAVVPKHDTETQKWLTGQGIKVHPYEGHIEKAIEEAANANDLKLSEADLVSAWEPLVKADAGGVWWHGTPSGDLRGGSAGLHVGTRKAAEDALHARIGIPVEGSWDGSREYGKTMLAGRKTLAARGLYPTGYNADAPEEDHLPTGSAQFGDGTPVLANHKPNIVGVRIVGPMKNGVGNPHDDFRANGYMAAQIKRGTARNGYYYRNVGEDAGSISAVLPGPGHVSVLGLDISKAEKTMDSPEHAQTPTPEPAETKLVVLHNLSEANLQHAHEIGGLVAPSIAVARHDQPFHGFGDVSLVGGKDLVNPEKGVPVFDADIYSPRWPTTRHRIKNKVTLALYQEMKPHAEALGRSPSDLEGELEKRGLDVLGDRNYRQPLQALWLKEQGLLPLPKQKPAHVRHGVNATPAMREFFKKNGVPRYLDEAPEGYHKALTDATLAALPAYFHGEVPDDENYVGDMMEHYHKYNMDPDGLLAGDTARTALRDAANLDRLVPDGDANAAAVEAKVKELGEDRFQPWAEARLKPALGTPYIRKVSDAGNTRKIPYTLTNVLREMTRKIRKGEEFNYGLGSARAQGAKRFRSLDEIKKARQQIVDSGTFDAKKKELYHRFGELADKLTPYNTFSGERISSNLVEAIGESYRHGKSLWRELSLSGFKNVSPRLHKEIADFAADLISMPTEYFEAKPQRILGLQEFHGAVVPHDADPKTLEILKRRGLEVRTYNRDDPQSRTDAVNRLAQEQNLFLAEADVGLEPLAKSEPLTFRSHADEEIDSDLVLDMLGQNMDPVFEAARFLAQGKQLSQTEIRRAIHDHDDDVDAAALAAYGLAITPSNLKAIRSLTRLSQLDKAESVPTGKDIVPATADAGTTADEIKRAFAAGSVQKIRLGGKHSHGTLFARDPDSGTAWILKPGTPKNSPAAGVAQERASQSRREACFWHVAQAWGIEGSIPRADLVVIDGKEYAAIRMLGFHFLNLDRARTREPNLPQILLRPLLEQGILHKFGLLDAVTGNADRHGNNLLVNPETKEVQLIDHGSAFAGRAFDPARDPNTFVPFYLRAWTPGFARLSPKQKLSALPLVGSAVDKSLALWLKDIHGDQLASILTRYGIDPRPSLERLARIRMEALERGSVAAAVNEFWILTH